jgi:hypothetical protein
MSDSPSITLSKHITNTGTKVIFVYLQISTAGVRRATPPKCSLEYFLYTTLSLLSRAVMCELTSILAFSLKPYHKINVITQAIKIAHLISRKSDRQEVLH